MSTWITGKGTIPAVTTNYDRIIRKTPEEMAEFMAKTHCVHKAPHCRESDCTQCWLDWLKQEVKQWNR